MHRVVVEVQNHNDNTYGGLVEQKKNSAWQLKPPSSSLQNCNKKMPPPCLWRVYCMFCMEEKPCRSLEVKVAWQQRRLACLQKVDDVVRALLEYDVFNWAKSKVKTPPKHKRMFAEKIMILNSNPLVHNDVWCL